MSRPYPKPTPRKKSRRSKQSRAQVEAIRTDIYDRDGWKCVVSGSAFAREWPCSHDLTIQHGIGKGMGGSTEFDGPQFLRTLCGWHNTLAETNADFARVCLINGWSLQRNRFGAEDVSEIPVRYPDGKDYILTDRCTRVLVSRGQAMLWRQERYGQAVA